MGDAQVGGQGVWSDVREESGPGFRVQGLGFMSSSCILDSGLCVFANVPPLMWSEQVS